MIFSRSRFYGNYSPVAQPHHHARDFYAGDVDGTNIRQLTDESFYPNLANLATVLVTRWQEYGGCD
jgi:hypothetical protein